MSAASRARACKSLYQLVLLTSGSAPNPSSQIRCSIPPGHDLSRRTGNLRVDIGGGPQDSQSSVSSLFPTQHQLPWSSVIYRAAIAAYFAGFTLMGSLRSSSAGSENPRVGGSIPPLANNLQPPQIGGDFSLPKTRSAARARPSRRRSSPSGASSSSPTGSPSAVIPIGRLNPGMPVVVIGRVL